MKQVFQPLKSGQLRVADVPPPYLEAGQVLIRVATSLVSAGTERMVVEFAQKNLLAKALARPDLVSQVIGKAKREGVFAAVTAAGNRLDRPQLLGYSCAGVVIAVAVDVTSYRVGDRVACAGAGFANHAEVIAVPTQLVVPIAPNVSYEHAAFTTVGSIAMHGLRLAEPQFGETVVVIGLGLIGLISVQLARAAGCMVLGIDPNPDRCELATRLGASVALTSEDEFQSEVMTKTASRGADAVIITAASESNGPVVLAGAISRERAKVIAVGAVGLNIPRKTYFEKELDFKIARSYGPGRYDPEYEIKGHDYPVGYVRWTENRNMQAFVQFIADGKIDLKPLISHRFSIEDASSAYSVISGTAKEAFLAVVLTYSQSAVSTDSVTVELRPPAAKKAGTVRLGALGAGDFAHGVLFPALKSSGKFEFAAVAAAGGVNARYAAEKFGFAYCATDSERVLSDRGIDAVVIATRHALHSEQVVAALLNGKHVFCEKPLCLSNEQLADIAETYLQVCATGHRSLLVGFNRRFSPMAVQMRDFLLGSSEPVSLNYRINAGYIPLSHWIQDPREGGRIIGEVCHFVDLLQFLTGDLCVRVLASATPNLSKYRDDNLSVMLTFQNGSVGQIMYIANGTKAFGKERVEGFSGGRTAVLDDFRSLEMMNGSRRTVIRNRFRQEKGHQQECIAFAGSILDAKNDSILIPFDVICNTSLVTFAIQESLASRNPIEVDVAGFLRGCRGRHLSSAGTES